MEATIKHHLPMERDVDLTDRLPKMGDVRSTFCIVTQRTRKIQYFGAGLTRVDCPPTALRDMVLLINQRESCLGIDLLE